MEDEMDLETNYSEVKNAIFTAFNICAPTGQAQRALVTLVNNLEDKGRNKRTVINAMIEAFHSGIKNKIWIE